MDSILLFSDSLAVIVLIVAATGYFTGAIPFGLLVARFMTNVDIREVGSKSIGATNVLRTGNKSAALFTLLLDGAKGAIPCLVFWNISPAPLAQDLALLAGLCAVIGHMFSCWLNFAGGKGVATALGVALYMQPIISVLIIGIWLLSAAISRYSSVASLTAISALPLLAILLNNSIATTAVFLALGILVFLRHRGNIKRIIDNTESTISLLDPAKRRVELNLDTPLPPDQQPVRKPGYLEPLSK